MGVGEGLALGRRKLLGNFLLGWVDITIFGWDLLYPFNRKSRIASKTES